MDLEWVCAFGLDHQVRVQDSEVEVKVSAGHCSVCLLKVVCQGGLVYLVRVHLDPFVQAAGEHHPTDLKSPVD